MAFEDIIVDGHTPQIFNLWFPDHPYFMLSSLNGDFTTSTVCIDRPYITTDDFTVGNVPSSTLSCELNNADGRFKSFPFGRGRAIVGVQYAKAAEAGAGQECLYGGQTVNLSTTSFDIDIDLTQIASTKAAQYAFIDFTENAGGGTYPGFLYCVDDNGHLLKVRMDDQTDTDLGVAPAFFVKMNDYCTSHGQRIQVWDYDQLVIAPHMEYTDYYGGYKTSYDCVRLIDYHIEMPKSTQTRVITISDAYDDMRLLDRSIDTFVADIRSLYGNESCTAQEFLNLFNTQSGASVIAPGYTLSSINIPLNMLNDNYCSWRKLLSYFAEALCGNAIANRGGSVVIHSVPGSVFSVETIPRTRIVADGYERADFITDQVYGTVVEKPTGEIWQSISVDNPYVIIGNPLVDEGELQDANFIDDIEHFSNSHADHPITAAITEMNPETLLGLCDLTVEQVENPGSYDNLYTWHVIMYWAGKCYGTISSGGNETRKQADEDTILSAQAYSSGTQINTAKRDNVVLLATTTASSPTEYSMTVDAFAGKNYSSFLLTYGNNGRIAVTTVIPYGTIGDPASTGYNDPMPTWTDKAHLAAWADICAASVKFDLANWKCKIVCDQPGGATWEARVYGIR